MNEKEDESSRQKLLAFINSRGNLPSIKQFQSYNDLVDGLFNTKDSYLEEFAIKINEGAPDTRIRAINIKKTLNRDILTPGGIYKECMGPRHKAISVGKNYKTISIDICG